MKGRGKLCALMPPPVPPRRKRPCSLARLTCCFKLPLMYSRLIQPTWAIVQNAIDSSACMQGVMCPPLRLQQVLANMDATPSVCLLRDATLLDPIEPRLQIHHSKQPAREVEYPPSTGVTVAGLVTPVHRWLSSGFSSRSGRTPHRSARRLAVETRCGPRILKQRS